MDNASTPSTGSRPIDAAAIQQLRNTLKPATELEERIRASTALPQHPRSSIALDVTADGGNPGFNPAATAIASAIDHLLTWASLIEADLNRFPLPILSHYTLARAAYESSLSTLWLLDPTATSGDRIGRGYAIQLQSLDDMATYQRSAGLAPEAANAPALHARLLAAARRDGYVPINAKTKKSQMTPPLTHPVPSVSALFDMYDRPPAGEGGRPRVRYNMMSGLAHSRHWAIAGLAADPASITADGYRIQVNYPLLCNVAESTIEITSKAVNMFIDYRTKPAAAAASSASTPVDETADECEVCGSELAGAIAARTAVGGNLKVCASCMETAGISEGWETLRR